MLRKVSISWLKQQSGNFALKGITITEGDHSYDSSTTFREQDAEWLTTTIGAEPQVEVPRRNQDDRNPGGYPAWATANGKVTVIDDFPPLDIERANSTLLRHFLGRIIEAGGSGAEDADPKMLKLLHDASAVLRSSDCGTYYSVEEAIAILTKHQAAADSAKLAPLPKKT